MRNRKIWTTTSLSEHSAVAYAHPKFEPAYLVKLSYQLLYQQPHNCDSFTESNCALKKQKVFKLPKTRTEKARNEFVFRTSRLANRVNQRANFEEPVGLKRRLIKLFWRVVEATYDELNSCTWLIASDCQNCREKWTIF